MQHLFLSALKLNLSRLVWIRFTLIMVESTALLLASYFGQQLPYLLIISLVAFSVLVTLLGFYRANLNNTWPVTEAEFAIYLLVDVVLLSSVLFLSGGASNPLVSWLLIPLAISAAALPQRFTYLIAIIAISSYSLLLFWYVPVDALSMSHHQHQAISPHLFGMWLTFILSACLISYFVSSMAKAIRQQENDLQAIREETLRNEQLLAIGTLAASTAHDIGTPLSTMKIVIDDLKNSVPEQMQNDINLLSDQVEHCKQSLQKLASQAQKHTDQLHSSQSLADFFATLEDQWRCIRPEVQLSINMPDTLLQKKLNNTLSLSQAIINILNNSADVSEKISLDVQHQNNLIHFEIRDWGPGIQQELLNNLGKRITGTSEKGLGLGLFLTHATIERLGGKVIQRNHSDGGAITHISIPYDTV